MPLLAYPSPAYYVANSELTLLARFLRISGDPAQAFDFVSLALSVTDLLTGAETVSDAALTVSASIYNELQIDPLWKLDRTGYNFRHHQAGTAWPLGGRKYKAELLVTPVVGDPFNRHWILLEHPPISVRIIEDSHAVLMARIILRDGSTAQVADISSLSLAVTNLATGVDSFTESPTVADVMRNGTVNDAAWDIDETGWNLQHFVDPAAFPSAGRYDVKLTVTPVTGNAFVLLHEAVVEPLVNS